MTIISIKCLIILAFYVKHSIAVLSYTISIYFKQGTIFIEKHLQKSSVCVSIFLRKKNRLYPRILRQTDSLGHIL